MKFSGSLKEPRNQVIAIYIAATLILTSVALLFWATGFSARHSDMLRRVYFEPSPPGRDLTVDVRFKDWHELGAKVLQHTGTMELFNFPPFAFFVILLFLNLPHPVGALAIAVGGAAGIYTLVMAKALAPSRLAIAALFTALCTSYPFAFLFERANIEGTVWIPCVLGVYFFARKNYLAAALAFALATCIKPFPVMLFLLLLARRRYREIAVGAVVVVVVSLACWAIIGPNIKIAFQENLKGFQLIGEQYVTIYRNLEVGHDHSLFSFIKQVVRALSGWPPQEALTRTLEKLYPFYTILAAVIFCVSVFLLRKMPTLNQIFGIAVLMVLLPPVNNDYTLIGLYIPWAILLLSLSRPGCGILFRPACALMILCAVIFSSQYYLLFGGTTAFGAQVKTLALGGILVVSLIYRMPTATLDDPQSA